MISGSLEHILKFIKPEAGSLIREFYQKALSDGFANGEYPLIGDELFAKVLGYETSATNNDMVEAHNQYVDVQILLSGAEKINVYNRDLLHIKQQYSAETDCEFFDSAQDALICVYDMKPSVFTVLFPKDAHLAALNYGEREADVKKIVFKIYEKYFA